MSERETISTTLVHDTGLNVLLKLESQISDRILQDHIHDQNVMKSTNAFGRRVYFYDGIARQALMKQALAYSRVGQRTCLILESNNPFKLEGNSKNQPPSPLVVFWVSDHEEPVSHFNSESFVHLSVNSADELIPLALSAHLIAEKALIPVIVSVPEKTMAQVPASYAFPDKASLIDLIGNPAKIVACPTQGQKLFFGDNRSQVPNYFNPLESVATGFKWDKGYSSIKDRAVKTILEAPISKIVEKLLASVGNQFGKSLDQVDSEPSQKGVTLWVQGDTVKPARAIAKKISSKETPIHIASLRVLWPLPVDDIVETVSHQSAVGVLGFALSDLLAKVPQIQVQFIGLNTWDTTLCSAITHLSKGLKPGIYTFGRTVTETTTLPKQAVLFSKMKNAFPEIDINVLALVDAPSMKPESARTTLLTGTILKPDFMTKVASSIQQEYQSWSINSDGRGGKVYRIITSDVPFDSKGHQFEIDQVVSIRQNGLLPEETTLAQGCDIIVASCKKAEEWIENNSGHWSGVVKNKQSKVYYWDLSNQEFTSHLEKVASGSLDFPGLEEISEKIVADTSGSHSKSAPALFNQAVHENKMNNIARFFGESIQPYQRFNGNQAVPEPSMAFNAIPALTSTFSDGQSLGDQLPALFFHREENAETTLGTPWVFCPEGAFRGLVLSGEELFKQASMMGESFLNEGREVASKFGRSLKHLAQNFQSSLARSKATSFDFALLEESFNWLMTKQKVSEHDIPAYRDAYNCMADSLKKLPIQIDSKIFFDMEKQEKGKGGFLLTFVNPSTCNGCGLCQENSAEGAYELKPYTADLATQYQELWDLYETMDDTTGAMLHDLETVLGPLASASLSKSTQSAVTGSGWSAPGSGIRLGLNMSLILAESVFQKKTMKKVQDIDGLVKACQDQIQKLVSEALPLQDTQAIINSLGQAGQNRMPVADLLDKLSTSGQKGAVDSDNLQGFAKFIEKLKQQKTYILESNNGLGESRYGVIVTSNEVRENVFYPFNPFQSPAVFCDADEAVAMAEPFFTPYLELTSQLRKIQNGIQAGPKTQMNQGNALSWNDLTDEEKGACPPVFIFCGSELISNSNFIQDILSSGLPIKLIFLDSVRTLSSTPSPTLTALMQHDAFVGSTAIHDLGHFSNTLSAAMCFTGPALIHVLSPETGTSGNSPKMLVERSAEAIASGIHSLFYTNMDDPGILGTRLVLASQELELTPSSNPGRWVFDSNRFKQHFQPIQKPETDMSSWLLDSDQKGACHVEAADGSFHQVSSSVARFAKTKLADKKKLLELAGYLSPFADRIRDQLKEELTRAFEKQAAELEQEQKLALDTVRREEQARISEKVTDQLLRLTGYLGARK